jgi:hypothetical protein
MEYETKADKKAAAGKSKMAHEAWLGIPEEFWQEFWIPNSSGKFSRNDAHPRICLPVRMCAHMALLSNILLCSDR